MKRARSNSRTLLPVLAVTTLLCLFTMILLPSPSLAFDNQLPEKEIERNQPGDPDTPHGIHDSATQGVLEEFSPGPRDIFYDFLLTFIPLWDI